MKRLIVTAIVIALVAGGGVASARHYDSYHRQQVAAQKAEADKQAQKDRELVSLKADKVTLQAGYDTNRLNCEKGRAAYDLLSPAVKAKTAQPTCGPVVIL